MGRAGTGSPFDAPFASPIAIRSSVSSGALKRTGRPTSARSRSPPLPILWDGGDATAGVATKSAKQRPASASRVGRGNQDRLLSNY